MRKTLLSIALIAISQFTNAQSLPGYVPTANLVGWWSFSGNANDGSGHNHNGVVSGAQLTTDRFGNPNSSYSFNGTSNSIYVPPTGVTNLNNLTVSAWVNYTGDAGGTPYDAYFAFGDRDNMGYGHSFAYGYYFTTGRFNSYQRCQGTIQPTTDLRNAWHHSVVIAKEKLRKLFVDGILVDSVYASDSVCYQGSNTLWFGAVPTDNQYTTGKIDDIGFWDRALTNVEVKALYNAESVSVGGPVKQRGIMVYPNPANNYIYIRSDFSVSNASYKLCDQAGRVVLEGTINASQNIDIRSIEAGVYFLVIKSDEQDFIKIIKQ